MYEKLLKVAEMGHAKAMEKVAYAMLLGDYLPQDVPQAKEIFEKLALEGSPKAQTVIATVYLLNVIFYVNTDAFFCPVTRFKLFVKNSSCVLGYFINAVLLHLHQENFIPFF